MKTPTTARIPQYDLALGLRQDGLSFRAIATRLDVPLSTAHRWVKLASTEAPTGSGEAIPETQDATDLPLSYPLVQAVDLSTPRLILDELDRVYGAIDTLGYSAKLALKLRTLSEKLDAMRRQPPPPCVHHATTETVARRLKWLVEAAMQEFKVSLSGKPQGQETADDLIVLALYERVRFRFNSLLASYDKEDAANDGALATE